jgi:hypothetical protein
MRKQGIQEWDLRSLEREATMGGFYSLFAKVDGKWIRIACVSTGLTSARIAFQSLLLAGTMRGFEMGLRPAPTLYSMEEMNQVNENRKKVFSS